ncbi:hypothetical protein DTL92_27870, partial [Escherichia coli]|uniref:hypothetical protein n=1 Tax=Escherichia coli TaxID=562 RepID=UPI000DF2276F
MKKMLFSAALAIGFAPIFPDTCYHLTHYWLAAVDIPVASDNPVHYADAIRYNASDNPVHYADAIRYN